MPVPEAPVPEAPVPEAPGPESAIAGSRRRRLTSVVRTLALALGLPLGLLLATEGVLRWADLGPDPRFFVPADTLVAEGESAGGEIAERGGAAGSPRDDVATNPLFGYTYFTPSYAIRPAPARFARRPAPGSYRVVVLGGSAAFGDLAPAVSLARVLEVQLADLAGDRPIEVINAALPGIDSHVVRRIALEALALEPDALVIYAGNNEVVGPYGPGAVLALGSKAERPAPLAWIRWHLRLRSTRLARWLARATERPEEAVSGGSQTGLADGDVFRQLEVPADDPRLERVRDHYEANLRDIVQRAGRAEVVVLLSTVGAATRDAPPFASRAADLDAAARERLETAWQRAAASVAAPERDCRAALVAADEGLSIDPGFADLHYLRGLCLADASASFDRALEFDAQRYRADAASREIVRRVAEEEGAIFVDGAAVLAASDDSFYDHVHLRFEGVVRLASAFVEALRGADALILAPRPSLTAVDVAERLAFDRRAADRARATLVARNAQPMFRARRAARGGYVPAVPAVSDVVARGDAEDVLRSALRSRPDDLTLLAAEASRLERSGQLAGALLRYTDLVRRLPMTPWRVAQARLLAERGEIDTARSRLEDTTQNDPYDSTALLALGDLERRAGAFDRAAQAYERALERDPRSRPAILALAAALHGAGDGPAAAEVLDRAVARDPTFRDARIDRALLALGAGDGARALDVLDQAAASSLEPDAEIQALRGHVLEQIGRSAEAVTAWRSALAIDPANARARAGLEGRMRGTRGAAEANGGTAPR